MDIRVTLNYFSAKRDEVSYQFGGSVTANTQEAWEAVVWEDPRRKPSWAELEAAWPQADAACYAQKRAIDYPPITDQIDAIMKGFKSVRESGVKLPNETLVWLDAVQAVKDKYPVPSEAPVA